MIPSFRDYQESGLGNTHYSYNRTEALERLRGQNVFPVTFETYVKNLESRVNCLESSLAYKHEEFLKYNKLWVEALDKTKALEKKLVQQDRAFTRKMNTFCNRIRKVMQPYEEEE